MLLPPGLHLLKCALLVPYAFIPWSARALMEWKGHKQAPSSFPAPVLQPHSQLMPPFIELCPHTAHREQPPTCSGQTCWLPPPNLLTKSTASWLPPACSPVPVSCTRCLLLNTAESSTPSTSTPVGFVPSSCPRAGSHLEPCRSGSWQPPAGTTIPFLYHLWLPLGSQGI